MPLCLGTKALPAPPTGAPGPFALADSGRTRTLLASAGFSDIGLDALNGPTWFGSDPHDAHRFVLGLMGWMLDGLDDTGRKRALDALRATVTAHASSDGISFASGAWLIRAVRAAAAEGSSWTACRAAVGRGPGLARTADR